MGLFGQGQLRKTRAFLTENGMARIEYFARDIHDIIHPLSADGHEFLTEQFKDFLEKYTVVLPENIPIVLEIAGGRFTPAEKKLIDETIWSHFCLNMTEVDNRLRKGIRTSILYLVLTVVSAALFFTVNTRSDDVAINMAFIPFWFFAYRFFIFLLIDCIPIWRQRKRYRQIASLKLIFTGREGVSLKKLDSDKIISEVTGWEEETEEAVYEGETEKKLMEKEIVSLHCKTAGLEDIIEMPDLNVREFISPDFEDFLVRTESFFSVNKPITLEFEGKAYTEKEQTRIRHAIRNYYIFRVAEEESISAKNMHKITVFAISLVISALLLAKFGSADGSGGLFWGFSTPGEAAVNELIVLLIWFFGDFLMEFVLVDHLDILHRRRILHNCRRMELVFPEEEPEEE